MGVAVGHEAVVTAGRYCLQDRHLMGHQNLPLSHIKLYWRRMESVISGLLKTDPFTIVISENPTVIALKDIIEGLEGEGGDEVSRMKDHLDSLGIKELTGPFNHWHVVVRISYESNLHRFLLTGLLLLPGVSKAPFPSFTFGQLFHLMQFGAADLVNDQLGDPVAIPDGEGFIPQVDHDDTDLTAVIGIDGAW
jgi:hypothetical protein